MRYEILDVSKHYHFFIDYPKPPTLEKIHALRIGSWVQLLFHQHGYRNEKLWICITNIYKKLFFRGTVYSVPKYLTNVEPSIAVVFQHYYIIEIFTKDD